MSIMLNRFFNSYLCVGIIVYCLLFILIGNAFTWTTLVGFLALLSSGSLLLYYCNRQDDYFTEGTLFAVVLVYSFVFVCLYYAVSYYYDNDLYLFSKTDAKIYEGISNKMSETTLDKAFIILKAKLKSFDDWGAPFFMSTILRIYPSKIFLNVIYIFLGAFSSLYLYGIGKYLMSNKMAYIAAFAYSTSSFVIYFHGTFLKESIFLFLVTGMFYYFYKFIERRKIYYIALIVFFSLSVLFFRPVVTMFFGVGITLYYLTDKNNKILTVAILFVVLLILLFGASMAVDVFDRYTNNGNIEEVINSRDIGVSRQFDYIVNWVATFIGPFPSLVSNLKHATVLFGPGLYLKMILSLPFLLGVIYIIRYRIRDLYPMAVFCLVEMISLALISQAFELRKGLPHVPILFVLAFWYMDVADDEEQRLRKLAPIWFTIVAVIVLGWNILRQ